MDIITLKVTPLRQVHLSQTTMSRLAHRLGNNPDNRIGTFLCLVSKGKQANLLLASIRKTKPWPFGKAGGNLGGLLKDGWGIKALLPI